MVDQFISLVNPEREIQPFVVNLTGINSKMLRNAPKFYEVAKRIVEITEDTILVAHNAQFDYRILKTEFKRLGFPYERETLCTVELAKDLIPDQKSYSLGKLVRALGIPVTDRHRASGDALATVKLFKLLLNKDTNKTIIKASIKKESAFKMSTRLIDIVERLPSDTGVYYLHKADGEIIYVGKSKNIKNRVNQHFTGTSSRAKKMQALVATVTYDPTGNELIAHLKESEAIKQNKPKLNRGVRRSAFSHALYSFTDDNGYINLSIAKADGRKQSITTFSNYQSGHHFVGKMVESHGLCKKLVGLEKPKTNCTNVELEKCEGACTENETPEKYNKRVQQLIAQYNIKGQNMVIVDRGRQIEERSAILIQNGEFKGFGYYNLNHQINNLEILESIITPMENNRDLQHIIQSYLRKNKRVKTIPLDTTS